MAADEVAGLEAGALRRAAGDDADRRAGQGSCCPPKIDRAGEDRGSRGGNWRSARPRRWRRASPTDCVGKLRRALLAASSRRASAAIRHAGAVGVAEELDVAAERDRRESFQRVPCRSLKPNSSGPKPIEKAFTPTPHQRPTRKWPSSWTKTTMVRTNRKGMTAAEDRGGRPCVRKPYSLRPGRDRSAHPYRSDGQPTQTSGRSPLSHHGDQSDHRPCAIRAGRARSSRAHGRWRGPRRRRRAPCGTPRRSARRRASTSVGDAGEARSRRARKAATAISLAAFSTVGIAPPSRKRRRGEAQAGKRAWSGRSKVRRPTATRSRRRAARDRGGRRARGNGRSARACPARPGRRVTEPSRQWTRPWTIDCGWTSTSSCSGSRPNRMMRLDQLEPLVHQAGRIDVDLGAHRPGRVGQRPPSGVAAAMRSRVQVRNGPPEAVSVIVRDVAETAGAERLGQRVVLGIDRQDASRRSARRRA